MANPGIYHHNWKGGRRIDSHGYVLILKPGHLRANIHGYVFEHLLVLEETFKRPILPTEACHHIDGDRTNNNIGNLMLFKNDQMHHSYHARIRAFEVCGHYDWVKCYICKKYDNPINLYLRPDYDNPRGCHRSCRKEYDHNRGSERGRIKKFNFSLEELEGIFD